MDDKIPWHTITGGHNGFENLALAYVQDEYPLYNWKPTQQTRDGNKDAEAIIIFCFNDESNQPKVWMEAKYSTKRDNLSRYKLDSTIVSAIIDRQVKRIFFVTNINIKQNDRIAIIRALKNGLNFGTEDVIFCTRNELEIWLLKKQERFFDFFKGQEFPKDLLNEVREIDSPAYYLSVNDDLIYKEPLDKIYVNGNYNIYFSLYCPKAYSLEVTSEDGVLEVNGIKYRLDKEKISYIKLNVYVKKIGLNPIIKLKLKGADTKVIKIITKVLIASNSRVKIKLSRNENIKNMLLKKIQEFLNKNNPFSQYYTIFGPSGTGKSYLLEDIFNDPIFLGQNIIYLSFNYDQNSNIEKLLNLMLRFYFHLWTIEDIDLKLLPKTIPSLLKQYIKKYKEQKLTVEDFKSITENKEEICFSNTHLNKRIIVIDDAHKLGSELRSVLDKILQEFVSSKTNVFILIVGQEDFSYLVRYPNVNYESNELSLTQDSFFECMDYNNINYKKEYALITISEKLSLNEKINIFFIIDFLTHLIENNLNDSEINVAEHLNQYIYTEKFKKSVLSQISNVTSSQENRSVIQDLLHIVYFSLSGINFEYLLEEHKVFIQTLLDHNLIKKVENNKLVPIHDIYCDIFRDEFNRHENKLFSLYETNLYTKDEKIRYLLSQNKINLYKLLEHIQKITSKHQYYVVLYILSTIFKEFCDPENNLSRLFNKIEGKIQIEYYKLFYFYIYALGHTSRTFRSYHKMKQLEEHLRQSCKEFISLDFMLLRTDILGELINGAFESLEIDRIENYSKEQNNLFEQIKQDEPECNTSKMGAYILNEEILILRDQFQDNTSSARQRYVKLLDHCENIEYNVKCAIIRIRYARGFYHYNPKEALRILNDADSYLKKCNDSKWIQIKDFEISYVDVLLKQGSINKLKDNLNKLKTNLYNDYRRGLRTICAYYLSANRLKDFDLFFDEYVSSPRPMNERDMGLMHHLQGIKYLLKGEYNKSLSEFGQQYTIFKDAGRSYKDIIEHNINEVKIFSNKESVKYVVKFNVENSLFESDVIYIEPRLW